MCALMPKFVNGFASWEVRSEFRKFDLQLGCSGRIFSQYLFHATFESSSSAIVSNVLAAFTKFDDKMRRIEG
jgi:hypothetical protein